MNHRRYKRWRNDVSLLISEDSYNMNNVHKFVMGCFKFKKVDRIVFKHGMYKRYGLYGTMITEDESTILLDGDQPIEQKFITCLHEIFHVYFHDYENWDDKYYDVVEKRAEVSAMNMLVWYYKHTRCFNLFKKALLLVPTEELTKEDILTIKESHE
jgi:Zn-dependent peptidase ImmA (M78 family)